MRKPKTDPRAAIAYTRVSTAGQSAEQQKDAIRRWAEFQGVTIVAWHEDVLSGRTPVHDRPGLVQALAGLRERRVGILVAATRDRLARSVANAAILEQLARDAGAAVRTVDGRSDDETTEGRLLRTILDAFAEYEAARIAARTAAAHASRKARGLLASGAPYGFRSAGESPRKVLVPEPAESAVIDRIRREREQGATFRQIRDGLERDGIECRGKRWHMTSVQRICSRDRPVAARS
jgi:DNA invertase Pin-like site-specific DNA recombinase